MDLSCRFESGLPSNIDQLPSKCLGLLKIPADSVTWNIQDLQIAHLPAYCSNPVNALVALTQVIFAPSCSTREAPFSKAISL